MLHKIKDNSKREDKEQAAAEKESGSNQGLSNKRLREPVPTYEKVGSEKIDRGYNNTFIIQGRDRPGVADSGYGGKGATGAGRIDLIAGLASSYKHKDGSYGAPNRRTIVNPNFASDAARVYISQMADIDEYMALAPVEGQNNARSAIGLKADQIRLHSREDIKIVTGRGRFKNIKSDGEKLSSGGVNDVTGKICFIAGNNTEMEDYIAFNILEGELGKATKRKLQPVVKGDNLLMCLNELVDAIVYLSVCARTNSRIIRQLNNAFISHSHPSTPVQTAPINTGLPQSTVISTLLGTQSTTLKNYTTGLGMLKNTFITQEDSLVKGPLHITSKFVYTT